MCRDRPGKAFINNRWFFSHRKDCQMHARGDFLLFLIYLVLILCGKGENEYLCRGKPTIINECFAGSVPAHMGLII